MKITFYQAGYCLHPDYMVTGKFSAKISQFPMICSLIQHPKLGYILFDTGYNHNFLDCTANFPNKIYRMLTPVTIPQTLKDALLHDGISPLEINYIIISHLHADHISAIDDFPNATLLISKHAYHYAQSNQRWKLCKGVLTGLTDQFNQHHIKFFESSPTTSNFNDLDWFGYDLFADGSIIAYPLPGHAIGHTGIYCPHSDLGAKFLIADAVWTIDTIYSNHKPLSLTALLHDNQKHYWLSIQQLKQLAKLYPEIQLIPSHCLTTFQKLMLV